MTQAGQPTWSSKDPSSSRLANQTSTSGDSLALALAVAAGIHVALIGLVHFEFLTDRISSEAPSLDVMLVDWATESVPDEADFFAQVTQDGGGEGAEAGVPDQPFLPEPEPAEEQIPQPAAEPDEPGPALDDLISAEPLADAPAAEDGAESEAAEALDSRALREQSLAMARSPELRREASDFRQQPRRKFISAATREHLFASYMSAWIAKVERIGNINYPEAARRRGIEGSLVLSADILPDGSVDQVRVLRSSGHDILDESAVRIVRLSAPFAPFPSEMSEQVDVLTITRTWHFSSARGLRQR